MTGVVARVKAECTISFDSHEQGEGGKVDGTIDNATWSKDISFLDTVISVKDRRGFEGALSEHLDSYGFKLDMFMVCEHGGLSGSRYEDNDSAEITDQQVQELNKRGIQTFIVNYDLFMELLPEEHEPTRAELHELLPSLKDYDD